MFEVTLEIPDTAAFWRKNGTTGLLDAFQGRLPSTGHWFHEIAPSDELGDWLLSYTSSWAYCHGAVRKDSRGYHVPPSSMVFGFREASDAVLFKLTWGGL